MATTKTYRQLQTELDQILDQLQSAELDIDKALDLYRKGQKVLVELEAYLKNAKNEIEQIKK